MNAQQTFIDTAGLERIAIANSDQGQERWTEIGLYYRAGERRPFLAETLGRSRVPGEREFRRQRVGKSIEEVSRMFDNSRLADEIADQADAWETKFNRCANTAVIGAAMDAPRIQFDGAGGLRGAICWLYDVVGTPDGGLAVMFEADWGVPARTVRHTLKGERDGGELPSWCKAFIGALQHFDREAFHATRRPAEQAPRGVE